MLPFMKKFLLLLLVLMLAVFAFLLFFIPAQQTISGTIAIDNKPASVARVLQQPEQWHKWWPGTVRNGEYFMGEHAFVVTKELYNNTVVHIRSANESIASLITLMPVNKGTVVKWEYTTKETDNIWQRFSQWRAANAGEEKMDQILNSMKAFALSDTNIYGLDIALQTITDTAFVALRFQTAQYPTATEIYSNVAKLQQYISQQGAAATNAPILHVSKSANGNYESMVAVATSRTLPAKDSIMYKAMVRGNVLVATVNGGQATVEEALVRLDHYAQDKDLRAPAIPFALLVTDRLQQPDTLKWVTKVYYPVY